MNDMNTIFGRAMTPQEYAHEWKASAEHFSVNRHYAWMTQQLGDKHLVLEVGCGSGASTLSLVQAGMWVVSLEDNEHLVAIAVEHLKASGISVEVISLEALNHRDLAADTQVHIVQVNAFDPTLATSLPYQAFDALVCWMIGSSPGAISAQLGKQLKSFDGSEMPFYREQVHKQCYELGRSCLKQGGTVQIVDRMAMRSWSDKDALRSQLVENHSELAGNGYVVTKEATFLKKMEDSLHTSHIQYLTSADMAVAKVIALGSAKAVIDRSESLAGSELKE
ncbi:hypothetical protein SCD_n00250 [Sulfuricella denitrificans skB26]|uniref:Methyltransferase domain-containing protein n=1 Tax=Sulfuricella denitrificans (strain DSM 22764 / NBRC 105220 / skB26) TaxID=1163617 RepID=S6AHU4_SULDS|nr:class I SAM-dependent methyltransferase [Sulfuricella denitrificans]BAN34099.1 hypothetical protein SCD_n00250 [Sulfuricella denitrificans skB26]